MWVRTCFVICTVTGVLGRSYYSPSPAGAEPSAQAFPGIQLQGGQLRPGVAGVIDCIGECLAEAGGCAGVDYDNFRRLCYVHSRVTECGRQGIIRSEGMTHYRLTNDCDNDFGDTQSPAFGFNGFPMSSGIASGSNQGLFINGASGGAYQNSFSSPPYFGSSQSSLSGIGSFSGLSASGFPQTGNYQQPSPYQSLSPAGVSGLVTGFGSQSNFATQLATDAQQLQLGLSSNGFNAGSQPNSNQLGAGSSSPSNTFIVGGSPLLNALTSSGSQSSGQSQTSFQNIYQQSQQAGLSQASAPSASISGQQFPGIQTSNVNQANGVAPSSTYFGGNSVAVGGVASGNLGVASSGNVGSVPTGSVSQSTSSVPVPSGFVSVTRGSQLNGGYRILVGATEQQCLDICMMTSYCLAVDFDSSQRSCYVHGTSSYCSGMFTQASVNHYQRVPCIYGSSNKVTEVRFSYLVAGGNEVCTGCSLNDCLTGCLSNTNCRGIDYDQVLSKCYFHGAKTVCNSYTPSSYVVHIVTQSCPGTGDQQQQQLSASIYVNYFTLIRFMGPTRLPSGWMAYPGYRVAGGTSVAFNVSGDYCASLCSLHQSCYSFDYNTRDGSCWVETTPQLKCGPLLPTNDVYHGKKSPLCSVTTGTSLPYPYPVAIAA